MLRLPAPTDDTPSLSELDDQLRNLRADTSPAWGTMNAVQMVRHCSKFVDLYLGRIEVSAPIRVLARLIGPLFLRRVVKGSPTATPRNLKTLPSIRSAPDLDANFEAEVEALREGLDAIAKLEGVVQHPMYGKMDAESCKTLVRHHTAHHFHQFGLLEPVGAA